MSTAERAFAPRWPKIGAGLMGLALLMSLALVFFSLNREIIYEGIKINGIDVGGMSQQEAVNAVEAVMKPVLQREKLTLNYGGGTWEINLDGIGGTFSYYKAVEKAYGIGRDGNPMDRIKKIMDLKENGEEVELEFNFDALALRAFLERIDREISTPPVNATIRRAGEEFIVTPEVYGIGVDIDTTVDEIAADLRRMDFSPKQLVVETKIPEVTGQKLERISSRWSVFSTVFNTQSTGRSENLKIASTAIEGSVLKPGEEFSFNQVTGPRIAENGYQEAPVIFKGELVPGIGGGVCQVSSTLYNAVLYANLEIVERHNHTIPSAYVNMGQDATVVDKVLDFRFRNNTDGHIYIASWVSGNRIYAAIYGEEREEDIKVKIRTETVNVIEPVVETVIDPTLGVGEQVVEKEARKGYRVKTYRQVIINGEPQKEELLSSDYYKPENGLIRRGPDDISANTDVEEADTPA
ncbi:MAG: Vancomycin B-type resistance protein VanW [Firmicutes bacterium]|nr:Vancomycin B-type resistance protein VanW [Bacillota bacterium]MDI6704936.1 VanW family protein [Bacillota bacterium]